MPVIPAKDNKKGVMDFIDEIHDHTTQKIDLNRNMLSNIYLSNPKKFTKSPEINKIMENTLAWPKGHIPYLNKIKKPPMKKTQKEIDD